MEPNQPQQIQTPPRATQATPAPQLVPPNAPIGAQPASQRQVIANPPEKKRFSTQVEQENAVKKKGVSTQNSLLISEIRDGLVIMRDGSFRSVIMCRSINFDLMSEPEKEAIEHSYQGFLNSLGFPIQIFIRSRRIDLKNYIEKLEKINSDQENILLGLLMEDYIAYMRYLIESSNIMDKQFYIVVPYYPTIISKAGAAASIKKVSTFLKPSEQILTINEAEFNQCKDELTQRVQVVLNGLQQMNIRAAPLNTQELIELYYTVYNPQTAANEKIGNLEDLEAPIVTKAKTGERAIDGDQANGAV